MPHINNIFNIRINNISSNGSVNFGDVIFKGNAANSKTVGGQSITGDLIASPAIHNFSKNISNDPDLFDQPQTNI